MLQLLSSSNEYQIYSLSIQSTPLPSKVSITVTNLLLTKLRIILQSNLISLTLLPLQNGFQIITKPTSIRSLLGSLITVIDLTTPILHHSEVPVPFTHISIKQSNDYLESLQNSLSSQLSSLQLFQCPTTTVTL